MAADEDVVIRFTAEHAAAATALERMAELMRKLAGDTEDGGRKMSAAAEWAADGFDHLQSKLMASVSAAALFERAIDTATELAGQRLEAIRAKSEAAATAMQALAGGDRAWQSFAAPGDDLKAIGEGIENIGSKSGMGAAAARQAFGAIVRQPTRGRSTQDMLADLAVVAEPGLEAGEAASRVDAMADLREAFPEATREGAAGELSRRRWKTGQLETIQGLRRITHGADSFQTYSSFAESLGRDRPGFGLRQKEQLAQLLINRFGPQAGSESLEDIGKIISTPEGRQQLLTMAGEMDRGDGDFAPLGKMAELRGPEARAVLQRIGREGLSSKAQPALNDPAVIAGRQSLVGQIAGQPGVASGSASKVASGELEGIMGGDPDAVFRRATDDVLNQLKDRGYYSGGLFGGTSLRANIGKVQEHALYELSGMAPGQRARGEAASLREEVLPLIEKEARAQTDPQMKAALEAIASEARKQTAVLEKMSRVSVNGTGHEAHGTLSPAQGAGQ